MAYIYNLTDSWTAVGTSYSGIKMAVTNTASAAGSYLLNLTVSGATTASFTVDKSGNLVGSGTATFGTANTIAGTLNLYGGTSGLVTVQTAAAAGTWSLTLPSGVPATANAALISTTGGITSWSSASTDAILLPAGTTAQRPTGATAYLRYNSTTTLFEGYAQFLGLGAPAWSSIGGGLRTIQVLTSGTTYTTPAGVTAIKIRMAGGGGGGGGFGSGAGNGGTGGNTTFDGTTYQANGGTGGGANASTVPAGGGSATGGDINFAGATGQGGSGSAYSLGGMGGVTPFGGNGAGGTSGAAGADAGANTGSGGGGAGAGVGGNGGGGGGAGGYVEKIILSPSATYTYAIGGAGTAGVAGSGFAGGTGGAGIIVVEEYYG